MDTDIWTVAQAKAKLSELIEHARTHGLQTITRNGRRTAVVVDADEWERRTQRNGSLAPGAVASMSGCAMIYQRDSMNGS